MTFSASFSAQAITHELLSTLSSKTVSPNAKKPFKTDCLIIPVFAQAKLGQGAKALQKSGHIDFPALFRTEQISGKLGETTTFYQCSDSIAKLIVIGCGPASPMTPAQFRQIAAIAAQAIGNRPQKKAALLLDDIVVEGWSSSDKARCCAEKITYQQYTYTYSKGNKKATPKKVAVSYYSENTKGIKASLQLGDAVGQGMNVARELGNLPGNICTPTYLANQARKFARVNKSVTSKILSEKQMQDLGMGSLLSVSVGSKEPAQLIIMEYKGAGKNEKPHVLVGKGITFDTGGISLKPGASMDEMKFDMCGAASVFGTMHTLAELQPKLNVVAIVAAAENMPSDRATKPGDVVTSMAGKTIEVLNTDAEGRLVLCDALTYAERYQPKSVVDIATLTGACVVALGSHASGLFSNNDDLAQQLLTAGNATGDRAWHMPLWDDYKKQLKSNFADLANIGGREAGSITAACFLSHFTEKYPWAHLDIAGTAWLSGAKKGATGRPVPLLTDYLLAQK